MKKVSKKDKDSSPEEKKFPLPVYPDNEDIYKKEKEVGFDEDGTELASKKIKGKINQEGEDLDVPGSELDDADEAIGEEDGKIIITASVVMITRISKRIMKTTGNKFNTSAGRSSHDRLFNNEIV